MALHPGERHLREEASVAGDKIRRALEENQDLCRDLVEHSQDLLCVHDLDGRILSVNPAPALRLGYSLDEMLQKRLSDFVDSRFREEINVYLREVERRGESHGLVSVMTRSGEPRIWEYHSTLRSEGVEKPIVQGIAHDVTERVRTERTLREINEQLLKTTRKQEVLLRELTLFRKLLDQSNDAIEVVDPETQQFVDVNERACIELGYSRDEILSMKVFDIDPNSRERFSGVRQILEEQGFAIIESVHQRKDGTTFPVEVNLRRVTLDRTYHVVVARDITARKRAEEALSASNAALQKTSVERERVLRELSLFRTLLDQSSDAIEVIDPETMRLLDVNERSCVELGYSREELMSMTIFDIDPKLDEEKRARLLKRVDEAGFAIAECLHRRKDGTAFPVEVNMRKVRLDREYLVAVSRDITERKRAEERLREFERVVESLEEMIVVVDRQYRYVLANRAFLSRREMTKEQLLGRTAEEVLTPGVFEGVVKGKLDECFQGKVITYELKYQYPKTGERDLLITYLPVEGPAGIDRAACVLRDVTEQKRAEKALQEREVLFRAVYERSPIGITLVDSRTGRFLQVNAKFCEIAGRGESELQQLGVASITHPDDIAEGSEYLEQLAEEKLASYEMEKRYIRPDGSVRWVRILVVPMWDTGETRRWHMALAQDITEQRSTEQALRQSEERFRVAIKNSPIAVFSQDRDLRYTWVYNSQIPMAGCEKVGKTMEEVFAPAEAARIAEVRRRVLETGVGIRHEVQLTIEGKKRYLDTTIEPVLDAAGTVIGLTGAAMEITELRETSEALREAKRKLTEEKLYLEREIDLELGFGEIIGQSKALQAVMEHVAKVAASDATVLLLGETGTGKELVARAIHRLSRRASNSFIKMNCAAIPSGLMESELFGNEKGAFTGAVSKKIGRLELADRGTLFLDEIGEISLVLQPKLLRVLQDQEFERLGGTQTLKVDFRLIAATNRDLADSVRKHEFRSDLYYRLNVFPIRVPPLRERREDIRLLVEHFVQKCSRRMNKSITSVPKKTMDVLMAWNWPGNVRELEHFVERSVILTQGSVLEAPLSELMPSALEDNPTNETLEAAERDHILRALRESRGQIGGPRGAAVRLGLKRTTLQSKLKQLGIDPRTA